jgi:hypothetical protein
VNGCKLTGDRLGDVTKALPPPPPDRKHGPVYLALLNVPLQVWHPFAHYKNPNTAGVMAFRIKTRYKIPTCARGCEVFVYRPAKWAP